MSRQTGFKTYYGRQADSILTGKAHSASIPGSIVDLEIA
jgi:hypothetical protein